MHERLTQGPILGRVMLLSVLLTATVAIPLTVFGVATVQIVSNRLTQQSLNEARRVAQADVDTLRHVFDEARGDLRIMRELPALQMLIRARAHGEPVEITRWREALTQVVVALSRQRPFYAQIRYLDETGLEWVRVNADGINPPRVVPREQLQNKGRRPYFADTIALDPGQIYVSPVDLNQEDGRIEQPYNPVLRYATPLFDEAHVRRGILIINLRVAPLFDRLYQTARAARKTAHIVDANGFYLLHHNPNKQYGGPRDLNTGERLQRDLPDVAARLLSGEASATIREGEIVVALPVRFDDRPTGPFVTVIERLPVAVVQAAVSDARMTLLVLLAAACAAAIGGVVLIGNRVARPIETLTQAADRIGQGDLRATVAVSGPHEIRTLAVAFNAMTAGLAQARSRIAQHLATLKLINEIGRAAGGDLSFDQVLECALDTMLSVPGIETAEIFLWSADGTELAQAGCRGFAVEACRETTGFRLWEGLPGLAAGMDEILIVNDLPADPRMLRRSLIDAGFRSYVAIPIKGRGAEIGVLTAFSRTDLAFTDEERATLTAIGLTIGMAAANARLFDAQRESARQLALKVDELDGKIAELEQTQARLVEAERLRVIGQMAAGVAHDFNNALMAILGQAQLMRVSLEHGPVVDALRRFEAYTDLLERLTLQEQAILDAAEVVRKIREAVRPRGEEAFAPVSLHRIVGQVLDITRPRWKDQAEKQGCRITVAQKLDEVPPVLGNAAELREALTNLLLNALDAMPHGGALTIGLQADADLDDVSGSTGCAWVTLTVTDSGIGMSPEVQARLFEPFFTTKGVQGTGLGLAMVQGIVRRHSGEIHVESAEGWGTSITVRLPAAQPDRAAVVADAETPSVPGRLQVLVIDDEPLLADTLAELLQLLGHQPTTAHGGEPGLAALQVGQFDLVMTDLSMPGISGWEVARAVKTHRSHLPVILVTGWDGAVEYDTLEGTGVDLILTKPYTTTQLEHALGQAVALTQRDAGSDRSEETR